MTTKEKLLKVIDKNIRRIERNIREETEEWRIPALKLELKLAKANRDDVERDYK